VEGLGQGNVTTICERRYDQAWRIAQVFVTILEFCVANIGKTVLLHIVKAMPQLRLPHKRGARIQFGLNHLGDHISRVHINGAYRHYLLTIAFAKLTQQKRYKQTQLRYLFLVVVLNGVIIALLQPAKGDVYLRGPPDLGSAEGHLGRVVE